LSAVPGFYGYEEREAEQSINLVTCHDGFTLDNLVSYNEKHNEGNGEGNRDGANDNRSWNCGAEGPTDHPAVEKRKSCATGSRRISCYHNAFPGRPNDSHG
jgi:isoamylase